MHKKKYLITTDPVFPRNSPPPLSSPTPSSYPSNPATTRLLNPFPHPNCLKAKIKIKSNNVDNSKMCIIPWKTDVNTEKNKGLNKNEAF